MPIRPTPFTFHCPACGWCRTVIPLSDALLQGIDWFERCPQCGDQPLQRRPATTTEILKGQAAAALRRQALNARQGRRHRLSPGLR